MKRERAVFLLFLVMALLLGFGLGWWMRDRSDDSVESRTREAAQHMRDAVHALTR